MHHNKKQIESGLDEQKISLGKLMCFLSIALFMSGIGLDYVSARHLMSEIFSIRVGMCVILSSIICLIIFSPKTFLKSYSFVISLLFLCSSLAIQGMIFLTDTSDIAHSTYFAGLMLIIVTVFLGTYISTLLSIILSVTIITNFLVMSYLMEHSNFELAVNNAFFLGSALIVGVISNAMKNNFLAQILLLQSSLKESLRDQHLETQRQSELANIDSTTNIPNRRYGTTLLEKLILNADTLNMIVVIYFIDLNGFKKINDTYGHNVGDEILKITASRLLNAGRKSDVFFRQGGDEFIYAIMVEKDNVEFSDTFKKGITETISPTMKINGLRLAINASIGQAVYPIHGLTVTNLINIADARMYENKAKMKRDLDVSIPALDLQNNTLYSHKSVINISGFKKK